MNVESALRPGRVFGVVAVTVALAGWLAPTTWTPRARAATNRATSLGQFAGYVWRGKVDAVQGSWVVPRIAARSPAGRAGTWVGAQAPGPRTTTPFIQVGVNEERRGRGRDRYYAFWSDTKRGFHPYELFAVSPGDRITAALTLRRRRWTVSIRDATAGASRAFSTSEEGPATFNLAEWLQEDITDGRTDRPFPYPDLSPVHFVELKVNRGAPAYAAVYAQWMTLTARLSLAPGPLASDGFTLTPTRLGAPAAQYLGLVSPQDVATLRFAAEAAGWSDATPAGQILGACATQAASLLRFVIALSSERWPTTAHHAIAALVSAAREEIRVLQRPALGSTPQRRQWEAQLGRAEVAVGTAGHVVRRALHAPEYV